jgi:hypothetical protein
MFIPQSTQKELKWADKYIILSAALLLGASPF